MTRLLLAHGLYPLVPFKVLLFSDIQLVHALLPTLTRYDHGPSGEIAAIVKRITQLPADYPINREGVQLFFDEIQKNGFNCNNCIYSYLPLPDRVKAKGQTFFGDPLNQGVAHVEKRALIPFASKSMR